MARITQPSFTGGELAPSLHGRYDVAKYAVGAKTMRNGYCLAHGGWSNRPGTEYIGEVKDSSKTVRLIPFSFNTEQTYVLEFGDLYMRVIKDGGYVLSGGSAYEIVTPYAEADLPYIKFTQSADVMTLTCDGYDARELSRTGHTSWTLSTITFAPSISAPTGGSISVQGTPATTTYNYKVTAVADETFEESLPTSAITTTTGAATLNDTDFNRISWSAVSGATKYNVYKDENGLYGFIGSTESTQFDDTNYEPDLTDTPPKARNPFASANYPTTVSYYEQRRVFARLQTLYMSQTGNYKNMNVASPTKDDDAVTFTIAANQVNEIRHLVPLNELIAMTSGGEWKISGGGGEPVTPSNILVKPQGARGCSHVRPLIVGNTILFVQEKGAIIRDLAYTLESDGYTGNDLSILSNHLFEGKTVKDWAYAQAPHSIIWTVLSDGSLVGMTYMREQEVFGWHRHDTDGTYENVCVVSEGDEDAVYFVVKRTINGATKRYVERLHTRQFDTAEEAFFVDSGLTLDSPVTITGATAADPVVITAASHGFSNGDLVDIRDVVGMTELNGNRYKVANATTNTFELTNQYTGTDIDGSAYTAYTSGGTVRKAVTSISGLDHLEGKEVTILANGAVQPSKTVSSGAITLDQAASIVHVGLPYTCDLQPLDIENEQTTGRKKSISSVAIRVWKSRGMWVGPDADRLTEKKIDPATYADTSTLNTGIVRMNIRPNWDTAVSVFIRQSDPLPLTVLSISPEVTVGG